MQDELLGQLQADATGCAGDKRELIGFCHIRELPTRTAGQPANAHDCHAEDEPDTHTPVFGTSAHQFVIIASAAFVEKIDAKEVSMDLMEITEKERLSREQAAAGRHALGDALARHNEVEFERGGLRFTAHVPDEVDFKLEIEIGEDEPELEVELTW